MVLLQTNIILIFLQHLFGGEAARGLSREEAFWAAALSLSSISLNNSALALTSPVSSTELHQNFLVLQAPLLRKEFNERLW